MENNKKMSLALLILAVSAFCIGTTEFISVGLLPDIAKTFNIGIEVASITVSGYAIGVAFGAPILTMLTNKINRKKLLLLLMFLFILGNIVVTISPNFYILMIARILTAFAHGLFFSIAGVIASELVSEHKKASAISMVFTGLTVATITGVPIGTYIGNRLNWRISFLLITILGIIASIAIIAILPNNLNNPSNEISLKQLKILKNKRVAGIYIATILGYGGTFVMYTYVSEIIEKVMHFSSNYVSIILLFYGIALAIGNYIGGKLANKNTLKALSIMFLAQSIFMILLTVFMNNKILGLISLLLLGIFAFMNVPGLQHYVIKVSNEEFPEASNFASSISISSFNIGIFIASAVGAEIVKYISLRITSVIGALFVILAFVTILFLITMEKKLKNKCLAS